MTPFVRNALEVPIFGGLATALLIAGFLSFPDMGSQASGSGGTASANISAASATVTEMVEQWTRPQPKPVTVAQLTQPEIADITAPDLLQIEVSQAPSANVQLALPDVMRQQPLDIDRRTAAPPPPPEPAPKPQEKPKPEPELEPKPKKPAPKPSAKPTKKPQQAQVAKQESAGRAAQKAAGQGGGAQVGAAGGAQASTKAAGNQAKLDALWKSRIAARIAKGVRYPRGNHGNAKILVEVVIDAKGRVLSTRVKRGSGVAALDQAAARLLKSLRRLPKAPKGLAVNQLRLTVPLSYTAPKR